MRDAPAADVVTDLAAGLERRDATPDGPVAVLRRWEETGAVWRVVTRTPSRITVALLTCDGGNEMDRLTSSDPELLAFVGNRSGSEWPAQ